jgi:hypothetical protein
VKCQKEGCEAEATARVEVERIRGSERAWHFCAPHALEAQNLGTLLGLRAEVTPLEDTDGK